MNRTVKHLAVILSFLALMQTYSCKKKVVVSAPVITDTTQTYFSIKGFIKDQVLLLVGQPYSLNQFTTLNGKTDSTMVNFYTMDMGYVLKTFLATDISDPKFLGKYKFSSFAEVSTGNQTLMYEAKEPELFTRSFSFTVDPTNNMILSFYIETMKGDNHQRLLYVPLKVIQIQDYEASTFGKARDFRVEYRFLQ
jgi:hypothetical protein